MPRTTKLYVGNLPKGSSEKSVWDLFAKYGEVVECDIIKDFGFVHFTESTDAMKAVENLNNKDWNGSILKVQPSHSKVHAKPGMGNRGECIRCGKTGHLCRDCPSVRARDFRSGDLHEKTCTTLSNISKEINAMNGSIDGLYSFLSRYRENSYKESLGNNYSQTNPAQDWLGKNADGDQNRRQNHSNNDNYNSKKQSPYSNNYPPPSMAASRFRHQPYPRASERRSASSSLSSMSDSKRRLPSLSSSHSLLSSRPGRNSNNRDMNPFFRPPPEYYERRRSKTVGSTQFARSREH
ncbi:RNA-binding protein lark-like isoform X1 [Octopus vulgaris]|uniref:RNA-binding protein lark-like isoform X1 n=1 Tax=Octopus vulgaris TaxID=6645 RepID=A0AA36BD62_OCTVU|nr:RNA-binding protein lark-like isoform X1 [Octopus vulgaris]